MKKQTNIITEKRDIGQAVYIVLLISNTGEVYKPASWKAPAKIVRFNLLIIAEREYLLNPNNISWSGGHLYLR